MRGERDGGKETLAESKVLVSTARVFLFTRKWVAQPDAGIHRGG